MSFATTPATFFAPVVVWLYILYLLIKICRLERAILPVYVTNLPTIVVCKVKVVPFIVA
jgi:hypothetical protein